MADIELVIRISEEDFEIMKHNIAINNPLCPLSQEEMVSKVANGVPIPKGHGRLGDLDKLEKKMNDYIKSIPLPYHEAERLVLLMNHFDDASTIIEADVPKRRKGTPLEENDSGYNCENWIP